MTYAAPIAQANPGKSYLDLDTRVEAIRACFDCAQACTADADADLGEERVRDMDRCIRLCLDCADVCLATGKILSRQTAADFAALAIVQACAQACKGCGDECQHHAQHGIAHCQICMEACRRCERACNAILSSRPSPSALPV